MFMNARILNVQCTDTSRAIIHIPTGLFTPPSLAPTALQCSKPHYPYVDLLPFPSLRDNLLKAGDIIDSREMWDDLSAGEIKVWGSTPWDKTGWEVGERFARKWWFLMTEEVLEKANFWRAGRGDRRLSVSEIKGGVRKEVGQV
jgi:hypothetical protein